MRPELREKILAYNKTAAERAEKAKDMDVLTNALAKLPPGQLKRILTEDVLVVLKKYGIH